MQPAEGGGGACVKNGLHRVNRLSTQYLPQPGRNQHGEQARLLPGRPTLRDRKQPSEGRQSQSHITSPVSGLPAAWDE